MPKLTIVVGANGAGKSTWCDRNRSKRLPADFYNADSIAKGLGDWNSPRKQRTARELVDRNIESHLEAGTDFGFESTYSGKSRPDIVRRAKALGYETEAIFVGTTRPEINIKRVASRVRTGAGHDVPMKEIQRRWSAAQDNLARTADCLDKIELIDNSGKETRTVVRIREGRETSRTSGPCWAEQLAEKLRTRVRGADHEREAEPNPTREAMAAHQDEPLTPDAGAGAAVRPAPQSGPQPVTGKKRSRGPQL